MTTEEVLKALGRYAEDQAIVACAPLRLAHAVTLKKAAAPIGRSAHRNQLLSRPLTLL
jgi:hypothetical protein